MEIKVNQLTSPNRLDLFLCQQLPNHSRSRIQNLIKSKAIHVNQQLAKPKQALEIADYIEIKFPPPLPNHAQPENIPLEILYEDSYLVVINKASGMVVHPATGNYNGTLVNALLHHCKGNLSGIGGVERPGIVHRLDKETSGCIIVAKDDLSHQSLTQQFSQRTTKKYYLAVTQSPPPHDTGTLQTQIGRHPIARKKMAVVEGLKGKIAITDYQKLHTLGDQSSLCLFQIHTGRTHQIRVHAKYLNCPLLGDSIYGKSDSAERLMLHAWKLKLTHPHTQKALGLEAPIPLAFSPWLESIQLPLL